MRGTILFTAILLLAAVGFAQQSQEPMTYRLDLKPYPDLPTGKIAAMSGTADSTGHHFIVDNLGVLQPSAVTLVAKNAGNDLTLTLCKDRWDKPERSGSTKGTGQLTFKFRTWGEVRILVQSNGAPAPYDLIVWAGDDLKPPVPSAFVPMSQYKSKHPQGAATTENGGTNTTGVGGGTSPVMWIIAAGVAVIAVLLVVAIVIGTRLLKERRTA